MNDNKGKLELALGSWLVALAGGTFAGTMLWLLGGWSFLQAVFVGLIVFVVLGALISWAMMKPLPKPNELELKTPPVPKAAAPAAEPPKAEAPKAAPIAAAAAPTSAANTAPAPEPEAPAKKKAPAKKAAPKKTAPKKAAATKSEPAASGGDGRPAMILDAPDGDADDLKKITGVGPKLEQTLNELGIFHYEQVAKFKKKDIAWVDERLRFKGRIERDNWVAQAKELAKAKG